MYDETCDCMVWSFSELCYLSFEFQANTTQLFISPVQMCLNLSYFPCWILPCGLQGHRYCFLVLVLHVHVCVPTDVWAFCCCCYFSHTLINCYLRISIYFRFLCWCHLCESPPPHQGFYVFSIQSCCFVYGRLHRGKWGTVHTYRDAALFAIHILKRSLILRSRHSP